jgi:acyl-coenzyme A synthetase/AMP-(fatty) acid ligase
VVSPRIGPDWIRTADLGVVDEDGFVFHRGRADGAIMRGGFKILPETIEAALKQHPAVAEAVVVGVPDDRLGQVPAAAVKLKDGQAAEAAALETHLRERVLSTHIPTKWLFCDDYPRTISAKIDRQGVRRQFA